MSHPAPLRYVLSLLLTAATLLVSVGIHTARAGDSAPASVVYFDLAVDEARQQLYGSDRAGGKVDVISMSTLQVLSSIPVGTQPTGIDIDPNGDELAVALYGQGEIAFVDLDALLVITDVVPAGTFGPNQPYDVLYGRPGRLYSVGNPGSSGFDYVHVFDTASHTEVGRSVEIMRAAPRLAMTADQNTLYVSQVSLSPQKIYRFSIATDIPVQTAEAPHGPVQVNTLCLGPSGTVFASSGQVWSADLTTLITTLPATGSEIECAEALQRVYLSGGTTLTSFDANVYSRIHIYQFGGSVGVARVNGTETMLYASTSDGVKAVGADYRARAFLPLVLKPCPTLYADNFSNSGSGWPQVDDSSERLQYLSGEYRILLKSSGWFVGATPGFAASDYILSASVRNASGVYGTYGLLFGLSNDWSQLYTFEIDPAGGYAVWRYSSNSWTPLASGSSAAIHTGAATNRLKVRRSGALIEAYVNGQLVASVNDGTLTGARRVGLTASSYSQGNVDARFDDFDVYPATCDAAAVLAGGQITGNPETFEFERRPGP